MTKRIQALFKENDRLKEQVQDLERGLKKIEKALSGNVSRARRVVRKKAKSAGRRVTKALSDVTG